MADRVGTDASTNGQLSTDLFGLLAVTLAYLRPDAGWTAQYCTAGGCSLVLSMLGGPVGRANTESKCPRDLLECI